MAIARDAHTGATNTGVSSLSFNITVSGSDRLILIGVWCNNSASDTTQTVTVNGKGATRLVYSGTAGIGWDSVWGLIAPDTGTHPVVITMSGVPTWGIIGCAASYTGVNQTGLPDATQVQTSTAATVTGTITTVADNSWVFAMAGGGVYALAASTGFNLLNAPEATTYRMSGDSNGAVTPAGNYSMSVTTTAGWTTHMDMVSFAPVPPAPLTISVSDSTTTTSTGVTVQKALPFSVSDVATVSSSSVSLLLPTLFLSKTSAITVTGTFSPTVIKTLDLERVVGGNGWKRGVKII
jgi:hypothetical protein